MEQGSAFEQLVPSLFTDILINISKFFETIRVSRKQNHSKYLFIHFELCR